MANMSYCMFENTYGDLLDCVRRLEEDGFETVRKECNEYELGAMEAMYDMCKRYIKAMEAMEDHTEEEFELSPWGDE